MSRDISEYSLRNGIYTTCSGRWIPESDSYRAATVSEIAECCLDECKKPVKFCIDYCKNNSGPNKVYDTQKKVDDCISTCQTYERLCNDICQLSSPYFNEDSYYLDCAEIKGCLNSKRQTNSECIRKNADEILHCCKDSCIPTQDLDCDSYCEFSHNIAMNKDKLLQSKVNAPKLIESSQKPRFFWFIIFGIIFGIIVLYIVYRLLKNRQLIL